MIELKSEYPYYYENLSYELTNKQFIRTYAEDKNGKQYHIKQVETGAIYSEAVDIYPSKYTYEATDIPVDEDNSENLKGI